VNAVVKAVRTITELRQLLDAPRRRGAPIGFVPTMGFLHDGHRSLLQRARADCDVVVLSVFVNPTQFNDPSDLGAYPRDEARDLAMAEAEGVDLFFAPSASEMYPTGFASAVTVSGVSEPLEGVSRGAGHFRGVATVVAKLFNIVQPSIAYFGQKDAQQALVIRRMTRDLDFPVRVEVCPTVREPDGLAMSSRNARLTPEARTQALALRRGLEAAVRRVADGERAVTRIVEAGRAAMARLDVDPEYFAVVSADSLAPAEVAVGELLVVVAARVGGVRLIDNEIVNAPAPSRDR
jgi:pantoate--beta-alanine ligase